MIDDIHKLIKDKFYQHKTTAYSSRLDMKDILSWGDFLSNRELLDHERFESNLKEIIWGINSLELSVGLLLISLDHTANKHGRKGQELLENLQKPKFNLGDIHYWYHSTNCWESLYRVWERFVSTLETRFTPNIKKQFYFDQYVNFLLNERVIFEKELIELRKFIKTWNGISRKRNEISHGSFNPMNKISLKLTVPHNIPLEKITENDFIAHYELPNHKNEVITILQYGEKTFDLLLLIRNLCELNIAPRRNIA